MHSVYLHKFGKFHYTWPAPGGPEIYHIELVIIFVDNSFQFIKVNHSNFMIDVPDSLGNGHIFLCFLTMTTETYQCHECNY